MTTTLTNAGRAVITNRLIGAGTEPTFMGWGTNAAALTATSTVLGTEVDVSGAGGSTRTSTGGGTRSAAGGVTNDTLVETATRTATGAFTVKELGLFDAVSGGNLVVAVDTQTVALAIGDSIAGTFKITFA